jgi:hypothetical protein
MSSQSHTANQSRTDTVTDYVEGKGSGYTVMVQRINSEDHPGVEKQGYHSEFTLYTVFAGAEAHSSHDRYDLVRGMTGKNDWLLDEIERLEGQLD